MTVSPTDPLLADLKRLDGERFTTLLFAPQGWRAGLLALYAFNLELGRVRERTLREPMAGHLRLQAWRDALMAGGAGIPLLEILLGQGFESGPLLGLIDAREGDLETEPPARLADLEAYAGATGGALGDLAAAFLGGDAVACQMSRDAGTGYALLGLMRALPAHLAQGRHHLPQELMPQAIKGPSPELCRAVARVAERAADYLGRVRVKDVHRKSRAACLCALQAKTHLKRLKRAGFNPFDSRLSIPATRPLALWWGMRR